MQKGGVGYAVPDVHAYAAAKVRGEQGRRPNTNKELAKRPDELYRD